MYFNVYQTAAHPTPFAVGTGHLTRIEADQCAATDTMTLRRVSVLHLTSLRQ